MDRVFSALLDRQRRWNAFFARGLIWPGIFLLIYGALSIPLGIVYSDWRAHEIMHELRNGRYHSDEEAKQLSEELNSIPAVNAIRTAMSSFTIVGGICMLTRRFFPLAVIGAITACVPCAGPCCGLGCAFGIWAIIAMREYDRD
ncbi:MAG: hypothetical protein ABSG53_17415 [Thermoguttaceae bacterium]